MSSYAASKPESTDSQLTPDAVPSSTSKMKAPTSRGDLKGLVLAGGKGMRLRPLTYTGAKQLVPIANKPILFYAIEHLVNAGVTEIGIVTGETREQIEAAAGDGSRFGARFTYIHQPSPDGIADAVRLAEKFIDSAPFVLFLGDNFLKGGITPYVETFRRECHGSMLLLCPVDDPQALGVAEVNGGRVVRVIEKASDPPSNLAITGIYFFDSDVFGAIRRIRPSARGELEITDTIQRLIDDGLSVHAEVISGRWIDTGKHDDLLEANRIILQDIEPAMHGSCDGRTTLQGAVHVQAGARITNSTIEGPAIIGEGTKIVNASIGPCTSIDHDCVIENAQITGSVVLEGTTIANVTDRIENSLIGRNVELLGDGRTPRGYTLVLGDFSKLQLP